MMFTKKIFSIYLIFIIINSIGVIAYEDIKVNQSNIDGSFDMMIISPEIFRLEIQPLINHKNSVGIKTFLKTTEEIYQEYKGYDKAEQIKNSIKNSMEEYGISYVLIVGSVVKVPMRKIAWHIAGEPEVDMLVDLYYSDIYNKTGEFCSWDENENKIFGEENDNLDLYPDVYLGRLACDTIEEVQIVVQKIITYENESYDQSWFDNFIVMAGDTFPEERFPGATEREGEDHTVKIMNIMDMFNHTVIWTSKENFNKKSINSEISKGAGFIFYSGHGFPNGICPEGGSTDRSIYYNNVNIIGMKNGFKLPIVFLTACSTAKLDYNLIDFLSAYVPNSLTSFLESKQLNNLNRTIPCFAWNLVKHKGGGSIATIGSTQYIISSEYNSTGCFNPPYFFFESYNQSVTLGEMHTSMINKNIHLIPTDKVAKYTIMEHILLGDPSLKVGGYPS